MKCPFCDGYNVDDALYCRICGEELDLCEEEETGEKYRDSNEIGKYICKIGAIALCVFAVVGTICNVAATPTLLFAGYLAHKLWNM